MARGLTNLGDFGDRRRKKAGTDLLAALRRKRTVCLRRLGGGHAGEVRFSRFIYSPKVTVREMLDTAARHAGAQSAGRHVLAIEDTTELNYQAHAGRVKGLGPAGNGKDMGFFVHPCLAVDANTGGIIGVAGGHVWYRRGKVIRGRRQRKIAQKESNRWIVAAKQAKTALAAAAMVTVVCDREGDIYAGFARIPEAGRVHLLVRAAQNRAIADGGLLFSHADTLPERHRYQAKIKPQPGRTKRYATLALSFGRVELVRPANTCEVGLPETVSLNLVVVREIDPPRDVEPICWRLLTTHAVDTVAAALEIVGWYRLRWLIEQLNRLLKTQGFNGEESQVANGAALMKLVTAALIAAMQVLQLTLARDGATRQPISDGFSAGQVTALAAIAADLPGKTAKQSNPHLPDSLAWDAWVIARLGGWTGYASQKPPGPKTMYIGLTQFEALYHGWRLAHAKDV